MSQYLKDEIEALLDPYCIDSVERMIKDYIHSSADTKSMTLDFCPKCNSKNPRFTSGGRANSGKPMVKCSCCHHRSVIDSGRLTFYSHQPLSKWDQLIDDTFNKVPIATTAADLNLNPTTVWRMRMKLLHLCEKIVAQMSVGNEVEMDEKYLLKSHKGQKIKGIEPRKHGKHASKRGISDEQICLVTAVERLGDSVLKATNMGHPTQEDIMKISNQVKENSMVWLDGSTAYGKLLKEKKCQSKVIKSDEKYTTIDHINNVNSFHSVISSWYRQYRGVSSYYINRYCALWVLVKSFSGCEGNEIIFSMKKKVRHIYDFFRVKDMYRTDIFDINWA